MRTSCSVVLSRDEIDYLTSAGFLPPTLCEYLQRDANWRSDTEAMFEPSSVIAEEFREVFTEQLAKVGFDEAYEPTGEGRLLEDLIDRFYCP